MGIKDKLQHAWNAFRDQDSPWDKDPFLGSGLSYSGRPDRTRLTLGNEKTIIGSIYTKLGNDIAGVEMQHVKVDENGRFQSTMKSGLNDCLTFEANIDQAGRAFRLDMALTLFEEGVIAVVPVDTTLDPNVTGGYDIKSLRIGRVVEWYPRAVRVNLYDDRTGRREEIVIEKRLVAIIENPFFSVMNEHNSTLQRLIRKLALLDAVDEQSGSGKLDLIIQLPYTIKSEARRQQAETRRNDIEFQLKGSRYGIAYTDGTEKITQLNRASENNLMAQIQYLTGLLYSQLGLSEAVFNGTADESAMKDYQNRTIKPFLDAITDGLRRAFITKTARTQGQSIAYFRDPFELMPIESIGEFADSFSRNAILSPNEIRAIFGFKPVDEPIANELSNKNMPGGSPTAGAPAPADATEEPAAPSQDDEMGDLFESTMADIEKQIDDIVASVGEDETDAEE